MRLIMPRSTTKGIINPMETKFTVTREEAHIYSGAFRDKLPVTLPGVKGKHIMRELDIEPTGYDQFELSVAYGKRKAVKRGKKTK